MRIQQKLQLGAAVGAALLLALTSCTASTSGASSNSGLKTLKVVTIGITSDAGLSLGSDQGYFKDQGIAIQTTTVPNPAAGIAAVQSGQVAMAYSPSIPVLTALSNGVKLKVIAAADGYPANAMSAPDPSRVDDTALYVRPGAGITRPKDLVGKSVAIPARKAQLEVNIAQVVKNDGGDPAKIKWVVLDFPSAVSALKKGRVDAAGLVTPFTLQAKANGDKLLSSPGLAFFRTGAVGLWVTNDTQASDTALMNKLQTAIYKSNAYANTHTAQAQARAAEITKVPLSVLKSGASEYWPTTVKQSDIQRADNQLAQLGYLPKPVDISGLILPQPAG